jgi:hypothetical protein
MVQFIAFDSHVEVNGQTVISVIEGMGVFKDLAIQILADSGIIDSRAGEWYLQQKWLDAFKTISETVGEATLFQIGLKVPDNADWPESIDTIEKALASIDVAYHMNHRGGEIGHYSFESMSPNRSRMLCSNPYPCSFDRGIISAVAKRFNRDKTLVVVKHVHQEKCRRNGGQSCQYEITW